MYDAIADKAHLIPADAKMVAGYVDAHYAWTAAHWARFPHAVRVRIAALATTDDGDVLDCEPGNCTPAESVDWVLMRRRAGKDPTVYCNQMDPGIGWPAVRAAFKARGVPEPHYWVADYDGKQAIPAGAIGKQYQNAGNYDLSVIADYWPGIDPQEEPMAPWSQDDINALAAALVPAVRDAVLNKSLGRQGADESGTTTLGGMAAWQDEHVVMLQRAIQGVGGKVDALAASPAVQISQADLAAALQAPGVVAAIADAVAARQPASYTVTPAPGVTTAAG
ncbi:MAG TPA: hypothetical protein VN088_15745 [Nocardioides sp.]|nr:hypothetical protein [Nocardioides sp.]